MARGNQLVTIKRVGTDASLYTVTARRDTAVHPLTTEGLAAFTAAVTAGQLALTASNGVIIPAGTKPPKELPTQAAVPWITGLRYTYDANKELFVEMAGEPVTLMFETTNGTALAGANLDKVVLESGKFYGFGGNTGQGSYDKQWRFGKSENGTGGIPAQQLKLTFKRNSTGATTSYTFTPVVGSSKVAIALGGSGSVVAPPQDQINDTPPTWMSARYTYANNRLQIFGAPVGITGAELKVISPLNSNLVFQSGNQQLLQQNVFYPSGPLSGQGAYTQEWTFAPTSAAGSGIPATLITLTWKHPQGTTYSFTFTPVVGTNIQLFNATSSSSTTPETPAPSLTYGTYQRGVVLGNSFTSHTASTALGWFKNNGMAADSLSADHAHVIESALKTVNPAFKIMPSGDASGFETQYWKSGEDLPVYQRTTDSINSFFGAGNKVDLIILSIGENVDESTFNEGKFRIMLDAAIACVPKADQFTVVLRNSVWLGHNSANVVMKAYAQEKGYKFANMDDIRETPKNDGSGENYSPYYNTKYEGGVKRHYNDDGHAAMAVRILDQLKVPVSSGGSGNGGGGSIVVPVEGVPGFTGPVNRTYNYPVVPLGQVGEWNYYNNNRATGHEGSDAGEVGDCAVLENASIKIEVRKRWGCSIQIYDKAVGRYVFNWFDWGRQSDIALYGGPKTFNANTGEAFSDIGWNPIGPGNIKDVPSKVLAAGFVTGNDGILRHYSMREMIQWNSGSPGSSNPPTWTKVYQEQWVGFKDGAADVKTRFRFNRDDETFYDGDRGGEGTIHELPNLMTYANDTWTYYYVGNNPGTNDQDKLIRTSNVESGTSPFDGDTFYVSEPFIAVEYEPGRFSTLWSERFSMATTDMFVLQNGTSRSEFANPGTRTTSSVPKIIDPHGTWYHDYAFKISGTLQEGRSWANGRGLLHGSVPNWTFSQLNGRNDWMPHKAYDQKEPFTSNNWRPTFRVVDGSTGGSALESPIVSHKASLIPKLYIQFAYSGPVNKWRLEFDRNGQRNRGIESNKPNAMRDRYPNGAANGLTQAFEFDVINDGQMRTYEINTSSNSEWRDIIQRYKLKYAIGRNRNVDDPFEVAYFGVNRPA